MDTFSSEVTTLFQFLLPGFVTAWVFFSFTPYKRGPQFERVIQALIFTVLIRTAVVLFQPIYALPCFEDWFPVWNDSVELVISIFFAVCLGLLFSYCANQDTIHSLLRKFKITKENSFESEWSSVFSAKTNYIVLHLDDGRRIYGWPAECPSTPDKGHFYLQDASWLNDDNQQIELSALDGILINSINVELVEFVKSTEPK